MRTRALAALVAAATLAAMYWQLTGSAEERAIRQRFAALEADINGAGGDGPEPVGRAARLASHVTADVVVELGPGSPPIQGRETLVGMALRLQSRTSAFAIEFQDLTIEAINGPRAEIGLTALIRPRGGPSGEESIDAREFSAEMREAAGEWRIARVVAIDTLR